MQKLLFVVNDVRFFLSHRAPVALAAQSRGYSIHVATASKDGALLLEKYGFRHHYVALSRSRSRVLHEARSFVSIYRLVSAIRPDIVHLVTIKPVIYGGIAARLVGHSAIVAAISGMGTVFTATGSLAWVRRKLVALLYRLAIGSRHVSLIFQNNADRGAFRKILGGESKNILVLPGSGVSLESCRYVLEPDGIPVVCMAARLLKDKGVNEFVDAARLLRQRGVQVRFVLAGAPDPGNPTTILDEQLAAWREEGIVDVPGFVENIPALYASSHIVCLPSYREGFPKSLLEAAACGRPIVTTDVPGCRDAVIPERTGLLVPPRNAEALADAIQRLVKDEDLRRSMGKAGRELAEKRFGIEGVVAQHMALYEKLLEERLT